MPEKDFNPHSGHRKRMRERMLRRGAEAFADHELLELALFYALPRRDTNKLAHALIDHFGGLWQVLEADIPELSGFDGIGESAAVFLHLLKALPARAASRKGTAKPVLRTHARCVEYVRRLLEGHGEERLVLLCLDARLQLLRTAVLSEGSLNRAALNIRKLVEHVLRNRAACAVLAHNHPSGFALPSADDDSLTEAAFAALETVDVRLLDHIIVGENDIYSYKTQRVLQDISQRYSPAYATARQQIDFEDESGI